MGILETTLKQISKAINAVLLLDSESQDQLKQLHGSIFRVDVSGLGLRFDIAINTQEIDLRLVDSSRNADVEISGPPLSLLNLLLSDNKLQEGAGGDVQIKGDAQLARQFSESIGKLDLDWEELLASKFGDIPAHQIGEWLRSVFSWRNRLHESWQSASSEYLQEEARYLPTRIEAEHFMDEVDLLNDAVERLEVRLREFQR